MKRVVTVVEAYCDLCKAKQASEADLYTHTLSWDATHLELDLCQPCDNKAQGGKATLVSLIEAGRKPTSNQPRKKKASHLSKADRAANKAMYAQVYNPKTKQYECPEPGCDFHRPSVGGLSVHTSRIHHKKIGEYNL